MQAKTLNLHIVQTSPVPRDVDANTMQIERILKSSRADLVVLPELFLSGYQTDDVASLALTIDDPIVDRLQAACRETSTALVVGLIEGVEAAQPYNSLLAVDSDGTVVRFIRKTHLFGRERDVFAEGTILEPVTLCGVPWGVMNCFEAEFPEVGRTLALRGAEGFLVASANMHPYSDDHVIALRARSKENRLPVIYANRIGSESGHDFCGRSLVTDHNGNVVHVMDEYSDAAVTATVMLKQRANEEVDMLMQRRPGLYVS